MPLSIPVLVMVIPAIACAAAYAALVVLILVQARRSRTGLLLAAAAAATALWAAAPLLPGMTPGVAATLDLLHMLAWYGFCLHLYRLMHRLAGAASPARLFGAIGAAVGMATLAAALLGGTTLSVPVSLLSPGIVLRLALAIATLLLLENLYRSTAPQRRGPMGLACIALGALAAYDLLVWADAVLLRVPTVALFAGRPLVAGLVTPLLALAAARNRQWRVDIHVSRSAVFHSATLVVSGIFLLALAATGEVVRQTGGSFGAGWGSLAEIGLLFAGVLGMAVLLTSDSARGALRRGFVDHFFTHRYDYRREWQRCIDILSAVNSGLLSERVIRALAGVVDSPSGLLFLHEPGQAGLAWAAAWNTRPAGPLSEQAPGMAGLAATVLAADGPIVLDGRCRADGTDERDEREAPVPAQAPGPRAEPGFEPWLAVPLREPERPDAAPMGCILLARPPTPFRVDAEVVDLLRILAHEVAIHLAQERAAAILLQTSDLRAYGERFAFVAHDIKNVSSQLSLLLANAEIHIADPEFQQDMLGTVRASVSRIGGLIRRLEPAREPPAAAPFQIDPAQRLPALLAARVPAARKTPGVAEPQAATDPKATDPKTASPGAAYHSPTGTRIWLDIDPAAQAPAALIAMEPAAFDAAVTHLLDNAVTAAGPRGTVRVVLRSDPARVVVDIVDDGPGLSPEFVRDVLFTPFATRTEGGSGLGAFQARTLLRAAGGELAVLSQPGHGATMRLSWPCLATAGARPGATPHPQSSLDTLAGA